MAFEGMDTDLATSQASQLQNQGVEGINTVITSVDSLVQQIESNWKGADATNFQSDWTGQLKSQLTQVMNSLTEFHTTFTNNITQQQQASAN